LDIVLVGLNHKTAPIDIRECLAFSAEKLEEANAQARTLPFLKETMILSTCNRVEIYAVAQDPGRSVGELKKYLSAFHGYPLEKFEQSLYSPVGEEAVKHVFRVASSLDSMVVGETQILGQLKDAYETASRNKTAGPILHRLLPLAFHVAKRVRTETKIGNRGVSVSSVAVELARKIFETLEGKTALLIGAGEMIELATQHLVADGVRKVLVANRTHERALLLAEKFGGEAIPIDRMGKGLALADIVISATNSRDYILRYDQMARVMKERKQAPIFLIDIADPRDVEPRVNDLENVYLYNIDHLQQAAGDNIRDREKEAQKAESIVETEVGEFVRWYRSLALTPTIVALRRKFEEIRAKELGKALSHMPNLQEKERKLLEGLTSAIVNKILHPPVSRLKTVQDETQAESYVDALQTLFELTVQEREETSAEGGKE
jgi:glutamyl-tRNA reductase